MNVSLDRMRQSADRHASASSLANAVMRSLAVACCMLLSAKSFAGTHVQHKGIATLEVHFEAEERRIALSDTIVVTLTMEGSPGLKIAPPRRLPAAAKWILDDTTKPEVTSIGPGRVRCRQTYRFSPREPGTIPFVFPDIPIRDGEADPRTVAFDPIEFTVTTQITQPDRSMLRGQIDIEAVPSPPPEEETFAFWWRVAASVPLLGIALFLVRRYLRRRKPRSPRERALYEWRRLMALKLPERGRQERFIALLTLLLREYLGRDLDLPVRRQTTREFLQSVSQHPSLTDDDKRFLAAFLHRADAVKFAHVEMPAAECHVWAEQLHHFLRARGQNPPMKTGQASKTSPVEESGQSG